MDIFVPKAALPIDGAERANVLDSYFCDLLASAREVPNGWSISLARPLSADYYIDPELQCGLDWWRRSHGEVTVEDIPFTVFRSPRLQLSFQDSWTLSCWSDWLHGNRNAQYRDLTLLHLDDHDDFMSPRLIVEEDGWQDALTGQRFELESPSSVRCSVQSGAVGIGSFMAPLLHVYSTVHIRHLCATGYASSRQGKHRVSPVFLKDGLLAPGQSRPALQVNVEDAMYGGVIGHPYEVTNDLQLWLTDLPAQPVLLHVDMDYFCNRFNGASDWQTARVGHDPGLSCVLDRVDQVFEILDEQDVTSMIVNCSVAISPGFFPAEFWQPAVERLRKHVDRIAAKDRWGVEVQ